MSEPETDHDDGGPEACGPCARGGGILLAAVGITLSYMGADLVTGGGLTRALFGAARGAGPPPADNDGQETGAAGADDE